MLNHLSQIVCYRLVGGGKYNTEIQEWILNMRWKGEICHMRWRWRWSCLTGKAIIIHHREIAFFTEFDSHWTKSFHKTVKDDKECGLNVNHVCFIRFHSQWTNTNTVDSKILQSPWKRQTSLQLLPVSLVSLFAFHSKTAKGKSNLFNCFKSRCPDSRSSQGAHVTLMTFQRKEEPWQEEERSIKVQSR